MTDQTHTPLPWESGGCVVWQRNGDMVADLSTTCSPSARTPNEVTGNTEYIVRACNAFPALLEAMASLASSAARIVEDDDKPTLEHMRELNRQRRAACAAIEKAKETR